MIDAERLSAARMAVRAYLAMIGHTPELCGRLLSLLDDEPDLTAVASSVASDLIKLIMARLAIAGEHDDDLERRCGEMLEAPSPSTVSSAIDAADAALLRLSALTGHRYPILRAGG